MYKVLTYGNGKVKAGKILDLKTNHPVWVDIENPTKEELEMVEKYTHIPATQIRLWAVGRKRPVAIDFRKYSVITFLAPINRDLKNNKKELVTEPCVILISKDKNDFITIHKSRIDAIEQIKDCSTKYLSGIFKQNATFLLFTVLNELIADYYEAMDFINETVHKAEELALNPRPEKNLMHRVLYAKKTMIYFHKALISNREIVGVIEHERLNFLDARVLKEFRSVSSSITQLIEINSTYRDILNTATEIHLTAISNNLNTIMKKITSWGAIILFPSLIAGFFGMNFKHFPAFDWRYGWELSLAMMTLSVIGLYLFFKKKDWL